MIKIYFVQIFLLLTSLLFCAEQNSFTAKIESDVKSGVLSKADAAIVQLQALKEPHKLPKVYRALAPTVTKNGTALIAEIKGAISHYSAQDQAKINTYLTRPSKLQLPESIVSPSGLFRIHYTTEGTDASDPEFVRKVAEYFDYSYTVEIDQLGYDPPPKDNEENGPEWDIYMHNISDYGYTTYDSPVPDTPWQDYTGYVEMDNDFTHTPTTGLDGAKVTAAHEFFHLIHLGYRSYNTPKLNSVFLYEMCAAWMEDVVYNSINDYYFYLDRFFSNYKKPFNTSDGSNEYGLAVFCHMLEKKYGPKVIRTIWEQFRFNETFEAIDEAMKIYQSTFSQELSDFGVWNIFTGERTNAELFYPEGEMYPEIQPSQELSFSKRISFSGENKSLASDYILLKPDTLGVYTLWTELDDPFSWSWGFAHLPVGREPFYGTCSGNLSKEIADVSSLSEIWVCPVNTTVPTSDYSSAKLTYEYSIEQGNAPEPKDELISVVPNPFNSQSNSVIEFRFNLAKSHEQVKFTIMTERGIVIKTENIGKRPEGANKYIWNGLNEQNEFVQSGVYLFLIQAGQFIKLGKFAVIR